MRASTKATAFGTLGEALTYNHDARFHDRAAPNQRYRRLSARKEGERETKSDRMANESPVIRSTKERGVFNSHTLWVFDAHSLHK